MIELQRITRHKPGNRQRFSIGNSHRFAVARLSREGSILAHAKIDRHRRGLYRHFRIPSVMNSPEASTVLIIGGGTMGSDLASVFSGAGCRTLLLEKSAERREFLRAAWGSKPHPAAPAPASRLTLCGSNSEIDWASLDLIVECIPEQLALKQILFAELEERAASHTYITSNSSSFPITAIAGSLATAGRMFGLHFFMPAHMVPLVEVVIGEHSVAAGATAIAHFMQACGKVPVIVKKDLPGFLANRLQHALAREAFALIDAGVASPEDVDTAVRFGFGFRFLAAGPVLQRDHAGLEVHCAAAATIYPSLANNSEPAEGLRQRVARGRLGMKSGQGFFTWTPATIAIEKQRYGRMLEAGLAVLASERPTG